MPALIRSWLPFWHSAAVPCDDVAPQIDEELMFHFRALVEENLNRGLPSDDAWADAQRRFGSLDHYANQTWRVDMAHQLTVQRIVIFGLLALTLLCGWLWLQVHSLNGQNSQLLELVQNAAAQEKPATEMTPYPIEISPDEIREFSKISINFGKLQLNGNDISVVPISCKLGVTGLVLIGDGKFHYAPTADQMFDGQFRTILLRFNPQDLDALLKLEEGKKVTDKGTYEMAKQLLGSVFRHSYHSGMDALIPPQGALSAALNSKQHGDLLVSFGPKEAVVYSFTDRKQLYEQK